LGTSQWERPGQGLEEKREEMLEELYNIQDAFEEWLELNPPPSDLDSDSLAIWKAERDRFEDLIDEKNHEIDDLENEIHGYSLVNVDSIGCEFCLK